MPTDELERAMLRFRTALAADAVLEKFADFVAAYKANFDPNQPRVPAGNPDGGQWTREGDEGSESDNPLASFTLAARRGRSAAYCMAQYAIDGLLCNSIELASRRAACWKQAAERLANCLAGRQIPPLNY